MNEAIYTWLNTGWWAVLTFFVGWIGVSILAYKLLHDGHMIAGAFAAAGFGAGTTMLIDMMVYNPEGTDPRASVIAVLAGIAAILILFTQAVAKGSKQGKEEQNNG